MAAQLPSVLQPSALAPLNARSQLLISAASASANWCLARGRCCRGSIAGITGKPITFYYTTLHHLQHKNTVPLKATPLITFQVKINYPTFHFLLRPKQPLLVSSVCLFRPHVARAAGAMQKPRVDDVIVGGVQWSSSTAQWKEELRL